MTSPDASQTRIPKECQAVNVEALQRELNLRSWSIADLSRETAVGEERPVQEETVGALMKRGWARRDTVRRISAALVRHTPSDVAERLVG